MKRFRRGPSATHCCGIVANLLPAAVSAGVAWASTSSAPPTAVKHRGVRRHQRLHAIAVQELKEEQVRDERPPRPLIPAHWSLIHVPGSNVFELSKSVNIRNNGDEKLTVVALMEIKQPETTYRMDTGERTEIFHLTASAFFEKARFPHGGLEFTLTFIDNELVVDGMCVHTKPEHLAAAKTLSRQAKTQRELQMYRGPFMNELDEQLSDEIFEYLEERGINNTFAEYMLAQAHFLEQEEYLNWLELLKTFAT
jgi:hypothetical protein